MIIIMHGKTLLKTSGLFVIFLLIISVSFPTVVTTTSVFGQFITPEQEQDTMTLPPRPLSSGGSASAAPPSLLEEDTGFVAVLPPGWIANDFDNTSPQAIALEEQTGYAKLITFCEEEGSAFPTLGSNTRTCNELPLSATNEYVQVFRYKELDKRPEFAPVLQQGRNITANDLFLYHLMQLPQFPNVNSRAPPHVFEDKIQQEEVEILQEVAPNSVETVSTTDGQIVLIEYQMNEPPNSGFPRGTVIHSYNLYFVNPVTNDGYRLVMESAAASLYAFDYAPIPEEMQTIFETAGIILTPQQPTTTST
jgi:hypothetical protein